MVALSGKAVFFADMDDDCQSVFRLTPAQLLERTVCYFMLAPSVIIHPAYIWQSAASHELVHGPTSELLRPPFTKLELGQHASIDEYMSRRVETLRKSDNVTRELRAYEKHSAELQNEAKSLSIRFDTRRAKDIPSDQRDRRFRNLLYADLGATDLDRQSLAAQLGAFTLDERKSDQAAALAEVLQRSVATSELVSVDTVLSEIYNLGFTDVEASEMLRRRLLALYYTTYADEETFIPATGKLQISSVINPYDVEVFWQIMERQFGKDCLALSRPSHPEMLRALRAIRESHEWVTFTQLYFQTLEMVDEALWEHPVELRTALDAHDPGTSRQYFLRQIWRRKKTDLAASAFSALGVPATTTTLASTTIALSGSVSAVAGLGFAGYVLLRNIRRFNEEYQRFELVKLRRLIKEKVADALNSENRSTIQRV